MDKLFFEIHSNLPREGPGLNECTRKAFQAIPDLPDEPEILDVGCGPGMQTIELAKISSGNITAIDNHQPYLEVLEKTAQKEGLAENIKTMNVSMFEMDFERNSFDLIWAEGAIYIIGVEKGLNYWKQFLRPGGYMAFTEVSWLREDRPKELQQFWDEAYPAIKGIDANIALIEKCGYKVIEHFILPEKAWWRDYYNPLEKRLIMLREKYKSDNQAIEMIEQEEIEIELYRRYSNWYGYVFYIVQK
ncbi:Methyltransferase domain-containing protein [Peptoclostridium litorale DSM 5388]|uniref:Type 11 methyltransferase n=1 Tax=Peptoclostridium litorale DSM 5388 TaxID=1121324 RepID=A0A069RDN4_PEPLI|nr:class I SAM-dependent methyltransferase [Peptoclostridium litorale]KDR95121.1 type 11 methyltransferase [Peptoclostridium litorale DSM 5388]SIN74676.1 Methyltransferase domain-containing protein [Peptoclostridium litorale DSM 5388]